MDKVWGEGDQVQVIHPAAACIAGRPLVSKDHMLVNHYYTGRHLPGVNNIVRAQGQLDAGAFLNYGAARSLSLS